MTKAAHDHTAATPSTGTPPWLGATHLLALTIWLAALLAAGLSAALIFTQMKQLQPTLPEYAAYTGEHWKIAGGMVANKIFVIVDYVQLSCALVAILTLGLTLQGANKAVPKYRPPLAGVRILFLSIACALFCYQLFILSQGMAVHLNNFWIAAKQGNMPVANAAQAAFDADHPTASNVLKGTAASIFVLLITSTVATSRPHEPA
jgi:hypothetical protein